MVGAVCLETPLDAAVVSLAAARTALVDVDAVGDRDARRLRVALDRLHAEIARVSRGCDPRRLATVSNGTIGRARNDQRIGKAMAASPDVADGVRRGAVSLEAAAKLGSLVDVPGFPEAAPTLVAQAAEETYTTFARTCDEFAVGDRDLDDERARQYRKRFLTPGIANPVGLDGMKGASWATDELTHGDMWRVIDGVAQEGVDDGTGRTMPQRWHDALHTIITRYAATRTQGPRSTSNALVVADADKLHQRAKIVGHTDLGALVTVRDLQYYAERGLVSTLLTRGESVPLDYGAGVRFATPEQYRTLVALAGGCELTPCSAKAKDCHAHHIARWVHNHTTKLWELVLLCSPHHTLVHKDRWELNRDANGMLIARSPDGHVIRSRARPSHPLLTTDRPPL